MWIGCYSTEHSYNLKLRKQYPEAVDLHYKMLKYVIISIILYNNKARMDSIVLLDSID